MPLPRSRYSEAKPKRSRAGEWAWLEQRLEKAHGAWHVDEEIIHLPGWRTMRFYETTDDIVVIAVPVTEIAAPCTCGAGPSTFKRWGSSTASHIHDLPMRCKRTRIYFKQQRYRCACGKTLQTPPDGVHERHRITARLADHIEQQALSIFNTNSGIADETGVSELLVRDLVTVRCEQLERDRQIETPQWLAIDEVHAGKKEYCVLTDPVRRLVIELLSRNEEASLRKFLLQLPDRDGVQVVTIDMCRPYLAAVRRLLPKAHVVVDRYHVHNLLSVALKGVLQVIRDSMTRADQRLHMRYEHLLLMSRYKLSEESEIGKGGRKRSSQKELVKKWLEDVPDIAAAYWLKEDFSDILQLNERQEAERRADLWLDRVREFVKYFRAEYRRGYGGKWQDPFGNVPDTFGEWRLMILNYIDYKHCFAVRTTNAFAEFANRQIKKAYTLCHGLTYEVLRMKVVHGGVMVRRRPPHPADGEKPLTMHSIGSRKRRKSRREKNPEANVVRLERAREQRDETKRLITSPREHPGWVERFGELDQMSLGFELNEAPRPKRRRRSKGKEIEPRDVSRQRPRRLKHNRDQMTMF